MKSAADEQWEKEQAELESEFEELKALGRQKERRILLGSAVGLSFALVLGLGWAGCRRDRAADADAIRSVIAKDKQVAYGARDSSSWWEFLAGYKPERVDGVVAGMRTIDTWRCPRKFRKAYAAHLRAWEKFAIAYRANPASGDLSGEHQAIRDTWIETLRIAQEYGVRVEEDGTVWWITW